MEALSTESLHTSNVHGKENIPTTRQTSEGEMREEKIPFMIYIKGMGGVVLV